MKVWTRKGVRFLRIPKWTGKRYTEWVQEKWFNSGCEHSKDTRYLFLLDICHVISGAGWLPDPCLNQTEIMPDLSHFRAIMVIKRLSKCWKWKYFATYVAPKKLWYKNYYHYGISQHRFGQILPVHIAPVNFLLLGPRGSLMHSKPKCSSTFFFLISPGLPITLAITETNFKLALSTPSTD